MVNELGMTLEQQQRFLDPIIKFIIKNPDLFKETHENKDENKNSNT
ncbi:hypothetical protein P4I85_29235 [Bacillus cereus]|nr:MULTISPECIES: hypothetical protein [Bacillus cereus group]MDA2153057.1 hypothetical protein [Bacillus cereus]MDA2561861.1 hypothetical protein [Bacillus cereus]MDA2615978.1 hypothetical protein [Bacillus cereus]MEB9163944.1 hypothetical protein [Bacillus cereus]MEB9512803.1 hypothetical protein [Bacillus cereus]